MKRFFAVCFACLPMLMSGCIEGQEEIFIGKDGSARVRAQYRVPGVFFSAADAEELKADIARELGRQKHIKLLVNQVVREDGNRILTLEMATDDIMSLEGLLSEHTLEKEPSKADRVLHTIVGSINVELDGLDATVSRKINLTPLIEAYMGEGKASMLGDSEFRYTVHLPVAAVKSNAHETSNEGRTLKWTHRLVECKGKPIVLTMVAPISLPRWVYAVAALVFVALAGGLYVAGRRLRGRGNGRMANGRRRT